MNSKNNSDSHTTHIKQLGEVKETSNASSTASNVPSILYNEKNNTGRPELVNTVVDEVMNHPPNWLLRWGTTLFFTILIVILAVTWFVKYPDIISAPLRILSDELPKSIVVRSEGKLDKLLVRNNQHVEKGQILALLESTAEYTDVLKLDSIISKLIEKEDDMEHIYRMQIPLYFNLGDLQKSYQAFQEAYIRSKAALRSGTFSKKKVTISSEINSLRSLRNNAYEQLHLYERDLQMAYEEAESQQRLADKGYVSTLEAKNAMSRYINKKQALEQAKATLENNTINQNQKRYELLEIDKTIEEHSVNLLQTIYSLKSDIEIWKQRYMAIAPISGTVHFILPLQENQQLKTGDEFMLILPPSGKYLGEMWVGQYNFGKVKVGQEVIVKFDSYPFEEFGSVSGKINYIGNIPKDSVTLVNVIFPDGLVTNSYRNLSYKFGMKANAEIVTDDVRLIERFFYDIRKILKR